MKTTLPDSQKVPNVPSIPKRALYIFLKYLVSFAYQMVILTLGKLFKLKSGEIWETVQIRGGGSSKNQKSPKFQLGKVQN